MQRALGYDNSPALPVPLRFFLNVPLFALLAAALILWAGPAALASRWAPATLALTHLFTLGILGSAMLGATMQILPVACNVHFPQAERLAPWIWGSLTLGTFTLVLGFLEMRASLFDAASLLLAAAFAGFIGLAAAGLWQGRQLAYPGAREILRAIRIALLALALTVALGLTLAAALAHGLPLTGLASLHVLWGLGGWAGILLIGISFQLIPIFQVTEIYPRALTRWLAIAILSMAIAWTLLASLPGAPATGIAGLALAAAYGLYAATTFHLLWTRKRPKAEPTTLFWRFAMLCLLGCMPAWLWLVARPSQAAALVLGSLIIAGTLYSAVNGMLYKILPFLLWKHAQDALATPGRDLALARATLRTMPKIDAYLPEARANGQFIAHALAVLTWLGACVAPARLIYAAGLLFLISSLWLAVNLARALRLYRQTLRAIAALPPTGAPAGVRAHSNVDKSA
ncbi:MAG: hypothetical protein EPN41_12075 [Candidimonas sp.]|nr:MAG: hypothetical protein EPN41_12075 [Candidimonas sp.]